VQKRVSVCVTQNPMSNKSNEPSVETDEIKSYKKEISELEILLKTGK
jgi:hypothetical protein